MAKVLRSSAVKPAAKSKTGAAPLEVVLPTEYEEPAGELNDFSFLIHGEKKIGKTTLSLQGGRVLVLQFDPAQISYRRMEIVCKNWAIFNASLKALEKAAQTNRFPYDRVVIDRADVWFRLAQKEACSLLGIDHPSEESWGKGWDAVRQKFTDAVDRILRLPCGKWFTCHSDWKEEENRHGDKVNKLVPDLPGTAEEILNGKVDGWFAYMYERKHRVLVIRGDDRTGAGHRIDGHFCTPKGDPIVVVPMGASAQQGYRNLVKAFENLQSAADPLKK